MDWHSMSCDETLKALDVDIKNGLSLKKVSKQTKKFGENKLKEKKHKSIFKKFIEQFSDFMVIILLIAAVVSFITAIIDESGDYIDSIIILVIVIMNAIIGVVQESKAERAIDALKKLSSPKAKVIRNSKQISIDSKDVVPGDILVLNTGDYVAADSRIIKSYDLKAEESALTGESLPSEKSANKVCKKNTPLGDRKNMLYATSTITSGHAICAVVATGMDTQVGKIANMINEEESPQTPLQIRLAKVGKYLGIGALIICFVIFVLGIVESIPPLEMFMISISLAVAAIPEGLPAVVTIVLALGVKRMANNRAIIRRLPVVETLGAASVICSDKTGTLTQNKMTVTEIRSIDQVLDIKSDLAGEILKHCTLCNNSVLTGSYKKFTVTGDPTETALVTAAANNKKFKNQLDSEFERVMEIPFDSKRKIMTTVHKIQNNRYRVITKGAIDVVLGLCTSYDKDGIKYKLNYSEKSKIERNNEQMATKALRVLCVAYKDIDTLPTNKQTLEKDLCFLGLVGMIDPPREGVKKSVDQCKKASIRPVMITGDHVLTAKAIAKEIGILNPGDKAITGSEIERMPQSELEEKIFSYSVFARVSPEHKVRIIKAFQKNGAIVAMTGDGVNDAPALKVADIGCAMGKSGTDVAKGAADMILTDDNFSTIVEAVKQGRGIFENIKRTVHFLLSSNIGEIITVLSAFLLKLPAPLIAIQLLWVNLVTDSFPALALGVEPVEDDIMDRKPINPKKSLFSNGTGYNIIIEGCFIGAISLLAFSIGRTFFDTTKVPIIGRTMAFAVLSISQIVHAFNIRSEKSIFKTGLFGNTKMILSFIICLILQVSVISIPAVSAVFKTYTLTGLQWLIVALLSISPLVVVEIEKYFNSLLKKLNFSRVKCHFSRV